MQTSAIQNFTSNNYENLKNKFQNNSSASSSNTMAEQSKKQLTPAQKGLIIAGGVCAVSFGAIAIGSLVKNRSLPDLFQYKPKEVDSTWGKFDIYAPTVEGTCRNVITKNYITPILNKKVPNNGFMILGPYSKGRERFINWSIVEFQKAGVEVIDATDPITKKATDKSVLYALGNAGLGTKERELEFAKTGKYKLVLVRNLDDLGYLEDGTKTGNLLLKGETAKSAERYGIILGYGAKDDKGYEIATRIERIDDKLCVPPLKADTLDMWKEYLESIKYKKHPVWAKKAVEEAREILSDRGEDVMKEMEPYLKFHAPYDLPNIKGRPDPNLKHWDIFFEYVTRDLTERQAAAQCQEAVNFVVTEYVNGRIPKSRYDAIIEKITNNTPKKYLDIIITTIQVALQQRV